MGYRVLNKTTSSRRPREAQANIEKKPLARSSHGPIGGEKPAGLAGAPKVWYWDGRSQLKRLGFRRLPAHGAIPLPASVQKTHASEPPDT